MIERPKFLPKKDIILINDVPVKKEIELEEKFCSASNLNMLTSLRTGRLNTFNQTPVKNHKGIISTKIFTTYFDYTYYGEPDIEGNYDFKNEFRKKSELKEIRTREQETDPTAPIYLVEKDVEALTEKSICKHTFYKLAHQKDVYISFRLQENLEFTLKAIQEVGPDLLVITGKWSLFFLTGKIPLSKTLGNYKDKKPLGGLTTYRASIMEIHPCFGIKSPVVLPIYHPVTSMAIPDKVPMLELDIQKVSRVYNNIKEFGKEYYTLEERKLIAGEDKGAIVDFLQDLLARLEEKPTLVSIDVETMFSEIVDCIGFTDSVDKGLCVPFAKVGNPNIWSLKDEVDIMELVYKVMNHKNCLHVGQNYNYDTSFFNRLWCLDIHATYDSMILHHILYNFLPKDLAFLASIYCEKYTYWKGEIDATKESPEVRWKYNAKDITYTLEVTNALIKILEKQDKKLQELYRFQQSKLSPILDSMMWGGVRVDVARKEELYKFFTNILEETKLKINDVLGETFNINSTPQKKAVFKDLLNMELVKTRKGTETCDAAAMLVYLEEYPLYKPFLQLLLEFSSLKVFTNNFLGMELDEDGRARTQYKIAGTATGRLASTKNVWGRGGNLMNIPSKGKIDLTQSIELADTESATFESVEVDGIIKLPNVKKIFLPDEGMEMFDCDLSGADIQIVASDSECKWLIDYFANPRGCGKVYAYIASNFLQREVDVTSREYKVYKGVFHGTNYLMGINKLASMAGISVQLAQELQNYYYSLCPEVRLWQERVVREIQTKGYLTNILGRRGWYLNRNDPMLKNKAASFIPQSTIADVVNKAMVAVSERYPEVQLLLQVHDSLVGQYPKEKAEFYRPAMLDCMEVALPYNPILKIPADIQVSQRSYGDVRSL